jgi:predicted DNA-binding transcriptional regulator AlpA
MTAPRRMLNLEGVLGIVPVSRATLFRMIRAGTFPRPTHISPHRRTWYEDEIVAWQTAIDSSQASRQPKRKRG